MRLLLNVFAEAGKLNAMLAVAQELERRAHEVVFYCAYGDISAKVKAAGLSARCIGGVAAEGFSQASTNRAAVFTEKMGNPKWAAHWLKGVLLADVPRQVDEITAALSDVKPDVFVTHPMSYAGAIAATRAKIPWAAVSTGFMALIPDAGESSARETFAHLADARQKVFARYAVDLACRVSDVISPWLNIMFASEEMFPRSISGNDHSHLVGPCAPRQGRGDENRFPWDQLPRDRPIVLVAFGSHLAPRPGTYAALIDALSPDEAYFVIVTRERGDLPDALPPHVMITPWVPQLPMLERASVMVNHGGSNSVMECISRGKPMLSIPFLYDQPEIARRVAASGAGIMLENDRVTKDACRAALLALLDPTGPTLRTAELARSLPDGAAATCDLLERLAAGEALRQPGHA
ncbi:MAG TPA: nucleotide disphospho-sugar-binding domain-containing protein [Kofleriaceae bacterium]|jgi:MGT family glycosyltransferase